MTKCTGQETKRTIDSQVSRERPGVVDKVQPEEYVQYKWNSQEKNSFLTKTTTATQSRKTAALAHLQSL